MTALHHRRPTNAARNERRPAGSRGILRTTAGILLWVLAVLGVLSGGLWVANRVGWVQPLVVVSGSMSPTIETGDLVIALGKPADELAVGEIASLHSDVTGKYVTHRVTSVTTGADGTSVTMRGDANEIEDTELYTYAPGEQVWTHWATISGGGSFVMALARPGVLIPGLLGLLAIIGFAMLPSQPARARHRAEDDTTPDDDPAVDTALADELLGSSLPVADRDVDSPGVGDQGVDRRGVDDLVVALPSPRPSGE